MSPSKAARCACSFLIAAVARGQPEVHDVLAMVQGGVHLRTEPSAKKETQFPMPTLDSLDAAMDQLGPFAIQSNTVGVRLPGNNMPGESSYWGADQVKAVSVSGVATKEGLRHGSFLAGGASADQAHAMYRAGYKPDFMSPAVKLMGAAQVHPGELNMVNAVSNKDGGMDYNKLRAELSTGHIDSTSGSLGDNMPQPPDGYPRMPPRNPLGVDPSYPGLPPNDPAQWPPAQKPPGAAEVKPEWPTIQIPHSLAEQKRTEEETKRRAEEARWLEGAAKAARKAEEARKQAEEAKAIEAWLQKAGAARQALSHPVAPPVPSKALEDWLKRAGPEWLRQNAEKQKAIESWARQAGHVHDPKADSVKRLGDFIRELGRASASQQVHPMQMQRAPVRDEGPRHISQVLKQMRQAAQATMTTPGSRLPALLQVGQEQHDVDEDNEKEVGETSPSVQTDAASEHQRAIVSSNMAMQKMQMAREKLQKAVATIQKAKRRMQVLQKDNRTSSALYAKAHEKEMKYAATALSYRLKQNERESLKGRHVKLDTKAYMQRINEGNLSSYGLWTIYKGKQQFGEKTWDILSNHIFGLDKMWKNLQNASLNEMKASKFRKLAKTYDAMAASALEENAQLESTIEKAQEVVTEAKAQIEEAAEVRAVQLAMKREAMRRLAKERAQTSAARHSMKKAARQARRAAKAEIEEEEEEELDDQDAKDDKEVEEILAAARDKSATEVAEEPEDAVDTEAMDKEMEEIEHLEPPAAAATE